MKTIKHESPELLFPISRLKLFVVLILICGYSTFLNAQTNAIETFTITPSDYYFNASWNYTPVIPPGVPDCNPGTALDAAAYTFITNPVDNSATTLVQHVNYQSNFPGVGFPLSSGMTGDIPLGPGGSIDVIINTTEYWHPDCYPTLPWISFINQTYYADDLYPPEDLAVSFDPNSFKPTLTWTVKTEIPENTYGADIIVTSPDDPDLLVSPFFGYINFDGTDIFGQQIPKSANSLTPDGYLTDSGIRPFKPCYTYNFEFRTSYDSNQDTILPTVPFSLDSRQNSTFLNDQFSPPGTGIGVISGTITVENSNPPQGVQYVNVTAVLQNPQDVPFSEISGCVQTTYSALTDGDGIYEIEDIWLGNDSLYPTNDLIFIVTPSLGNRGFNPESRTVLLSPDNNVASGINFEDTTSYSIIGNVIDISGCPLNEINVVVLDNDDDNDPVPNTLVTTGAPGLFSSSVQNPGNYVLAAYNNDLTWSDTSAVITVNQTQIDTNGITVLPNDFVYDLADTLMGFIGAGCNEYIGETTISALSTTGCPIPLATVTTDEFGFYSMFIPKREFTLEVNYFNPEPGSSLNPIDIEAAIDEQLTLLGTVEPLDSTTILDIIYRKPLQFSHSGLPLSACNNLNNPVLEQGRSYNMVFQLWEEYLICPLNEGYMVISNDIRTVGNMAAPVDTVYIENGFGVYTFRPGDINLVGNHLKSMSIEVFAGAPLSANIPSLTESIAVHVVGVKMNGSSFVTEPADLPLGILRDPPGDQSYSYLAIDSSITYSTSFSAKTSQNLNAYVQLKSEVDLDPIPVKSWVSATAGIEIGATQQYNDETIVTVKTSDYFSTSDAFVDGAGEGAGDVYIGAGMNFIFAVGQELYLDESDCTFKTEKTSSLNPNGFGTLYAYSQKHILQNVIPNLEFNIQNAPDTDQGKIDIVGFESAKNMWEQIIELNKDLKEQAFAGPTSNYSFDALAQRRISETSESTTNRSIEFSLVLGASIAVEAGLEAFGIGVQANVEAKFQMEIGQAKNIGVTTSTTNGSYFADDDPGDFFTINYAPDPVYGSLCFELLAGETSCPYEEPTARIDDFSITMQEYYEASQVISAPQDVALFPLDLANLGETTPDPNSANNPNERNYVLEVVNSSYSGVLVTVNFNPSNQPIYYNNIPQNGFVPVQVEVQLQNPTIAYTFQDIEVRVYAECDPLYYKSIFLSAYFEGACSEVGFADNFPVNNWLVNSNSNNELGLIISDYDNGLTINSVRLQTAFAGTASWATEPGAPVYDNIGNNPSLQLANGPNGQFFNWDVTNIPDGAYDIRFRLGCPGSFSISTERTGIIDRVYPEIFGIEYPAGDNYVEGSEISIRFNEDIDCSSLIPADLQLLNLTTNVPEPITYSCSGNEIIITPVNDISNNVGVAYEASVNNLSDVYDNVRPDVLTWSFTVNDSDSDGDGFGDSIDNCDGGDDNQDLDNDGIPDACDCFPYTSANAEPAVNFNCNACLTDTNTVMYFDGTNDYLLSDNESLTATQNFTYEFWVNPEDSIPEGLTESINGAGVFSDFEKDIPFVIYPVTDLSNNDPTIGIAVGVNGIIVMEATNSPAVFSPSIFVKYTAIDQWTHIAVTTNGSNVKLFKNGVELGSQTLDASYSARNRSNQIGGGSSRNNYCENIAGNIGNNELYYINGVSFGSINNSNTGLSPLPVTGYTDYTEDLGNTTDLEAGQNYPISITVYRINGFWNPNTSVWIDLNFDGVFDISERVLYDSYAFPVTGNIAIPANNFTGFTRMRVQLSLDPDEPSCGVYIDGETEDYLINIIPPTGSGANPPPVNFDFFRGQLDEVAITNSNKTVQEIIDDMFAQANIGDPGIDAYLDFEDGIADGNNLAQTYVQPAVGNDVFDIYNMNKNGLISNWVSAPSLTINDSDGDGVCDESDICPGFDDLADMDLDAIPDGCDVCPNDPLNDADQDGNCDDDFCIPIGDSDNDGVCDDVDLCPGYDDSFDYDNDGIPDACDSCPNTGASCDDGDGCTTNDTLDDYCNCVGTSITPVDTVPVNTLNGLNGFTVNVSDEAVSGGGDYNGDGLDDIIIGYETGSSQGECYIIFGSTNPFPTNFDVNTLDGTNGFKINGIDYSDDAGAKVSDAGDVNGDNIDDILISARFADPNSSMAGESYVVYGNAGGFAATFDLSTLNGINGFIMNGIGFQDFSGMSVSKAGDVNNDGFDDVIIGATHGDPNGFDSGESYVVFGANNIPATIELSSLDGTNGFTINGVTEDDNAGDYVSDAGDFNNDGFDDVLIGSINPFPNAGINAGASYIVFGKSTFAATFELSSLDGTNGFVVYGLTDNDETSRVSKAGDINNDGFSDIVLGAPGAQPNGVNAAGTCYVIFGTNNNIGASFDLSTINGVNGFAVNGISVADYLGWSVSDAGDVNNDGIDDVIMGSRQGSFYGTGGAAYVIYGKTSTFNASLDVSSIDGINGFGIFGSAQFDYLGEAVGSAGDVNNDGYDDLIVGASGASSNGETYIIFGQSSGIPGAGCTDSTACNYDPLAFCDDGSCDYVVCICNDADYDGVCDDDDLCPGFDDNLDVNNNGIPDDCEPCLTIGDSCDDGDPCTVNDTIDDQCYCIGTIISPFDSIAVSALDGTNGFAVNAADEIVSGAGDINGDGIDDIIIGDSGASDNGKSYIIFGSNIPFSSFIDVSLLDGLNGFEINGVDIGDDAGISVSDAGDVNGDNIDDVIIGAYFADPNSSFSGASYVIYGSTSSFPASFNLSSLDGTNGFVMNGIGFQDFSGERVNKAGDVNNDGFDDLIIGADLGDPNGSGSGEVYVVFGANNIPATLELSSLNGSNGFTINGVSSDDNLGFSVDAAGDFNNDGFDDVIVGAVSAEPNGLINAGTSYVVFGNNTFAATVELSGLDGTNGFAVFGLNSSDETSRVSGAGDVNNDGFSDIVIGSVGADADGVFSSGICHVIFGTNNNLGPSFDLNSINGTNGFEIYGVTSSGYLGWSVSEAGDVNNDGIDDLVLGARQSSFYDTSSTYIFYAGAAYVIYGKTSVFPASLAVDELDGNNGFGIYSNVQFDYLGESVSSAGDVNNDGFDDLIIAAGGTSGETYIVFGQSSGPAGSGCTDALACNYDPLATCDDASCDYIACICPYDLLLNNDPENADTYSAENSIESTSKVKLGSNGDVTYNAGNYILLNTGFEASGIENFTAIIDGCSLPE